MLIKKQKLMDWKEKVIIICNSRAFGAQSLGKFYFAMFIYQSCFPDVLGISD